MALTKYGDSQAAKVVSPEEHDRIRAGLQRVGKTRVQDLTDEERAEVLRNVDPSEQDS